MPLRTAVPVLPDGVSVTIRVPASSANLGPGFDCLGLALGIYDEVTVTTGGDGVQVTATGESSAGVPRDETHLVARAILRGLGVAGVKVNGLWVRCTNAIPHSRGLGSSAAAVVSGLAAASELIAESGVGQRFSNEVLVEQASEFEGHPDNAAASVLGGAVVTWTTPGGTPAYRASNIEVHPNITATVFVPSVESSTSETRGLLPEMVPRTDAIFNLSRSALNVVALTSDPSLLLEATDDRLHQGYRSAAMPPSAELVAKLRGAGHAATISGAGPTVLVLGTADVPANLCAHAGERGFAVRKAAIAGGVSRSA
ncbi:homoserine kinase [Gordonia effusa NBRC 100432]|uniref:Homoserine kinase n=1 Tax=Gordonia effusa NBRC 100432 TaxID=1077974 RepID=H0QVR2_9ACTN|nr:homoserine kinase [Gordonia effusa]GAB16913.1 homoserine kinase [Gordonia effusa NBRC 100432]